ETLPGLLMSNVTAQASLGGDTATGEAVPYAYPQRPSRPGRHETRPPQLEAALGTQVIKAVPSLRPQPILSKAHLEALDGAWTDGKPSWARSRGRLLRSSLWARM